MKVAVSTGGCPYFPPAPGSRSGSGTSGNGTVPCGGSLSPQNPESFWNRKCEPAENGKEGTDWALLALKGYIQDSLNTNIIFIFACITYHLQFQNAPGPQAVVHHVSRGDYLLRVPEKTPPP